MIRNANDAAAFVADWKHAPRKGIYAAVIDGLTMAHGIMMGARTRYGVDEICDNREAISVLRLAYRSAFGAEYTRGQ